MRLFAHHDFCQWSGDDDDDGSGGSDGGGGDNYHYLGSGGYGKDPSKASFFLKMTAKVDERKNHILNVLLILKICHAESIPLIDNQSNHTK